MGSAGADQSGLFGLQLLLQSLGHKAVEAHGAIVGAENYLIALTLKILSENHRIGAAEANNSSGFLAVCFGCFQHGRHSNAAANYNDFSLRLGKAMAQGSHYIQIVPNPLFSKDPSAFPFDFKHEPQGA